MLTLLDTTADAIRKELESIPEKYHKPFNSNHEGYAILLEEVRELEHVVFFGEKEAKKSVENDLSQEWKKQEAIRLHKSRLREEAIQIAAMAARIIQELT